MTAPYVTTVTKPAAGPGAGRSVLRRALLAAAALLLLMLAVTLLAWLVTPKEDGGRASWLQRLFSDRNQPRGDPVCSLEMDIGPCRGALERYYYSPETGSCVSFLYGGCDGNANNFETRDQCNARCGGQPEEGSRKAVDSVCSLEMEVGPCRGALERYYYSAKTGTCVPFLYGGCSGNGNNFETREKCNERCGGEPEEGSRKAQEADVCSLPAETGDCRAAVPRYHYDPSSAACTEFTYGGCGGNANNFKTLQDCEQRCSSRKSVDSVDCRSEPDPGLCMAYMEKYAYRPTTHTCEQFVYGGCGGNGNRYNTKEECEAHCGQSPPPTDESPAAPPEAATGQAEVTGYDTKACGVTECPADCGLVGHQGDCVLCKCGHTPYLHPSEVAVAAGQPCPPGYAEVRQDIQSTVCAVGPAVPTPSP